MKRPVFQADYEDADKFNASSIIDISQWQVEEPATAGAVKGFFSEEVTEVRRFLKEGYREMAFFYSREEWQEIYRIGPIVSFQCRSEVMRCGAARPDGVIYSRTFNLETGEVLQLSDLLLISPEQQVETIYNEHVDYLQRHSMMISVYDYDQDILDTYQCGGCRVWLQ